MLPVVALADHSLQGTVPDLKSEKEQGQALGKALGRVASGVHIVTLEHDGVKHGVLITWIAQASFQPPMLTVAFNKERPILGFLARGKVLAVNVLSSGNTDVFKSFARQAKAGEDRFTGLAVGLSANGCPVFSGAVAYLDCCVKEMVDSGDHVVCLVEVIGGHLLASDGEPMVHIRKNGFQY